MSQASSPTQRSKCSSLDQVGEHHEVADQDLVHGPDRLERVQVVLGGLALDVAGLAGQERPRPGGSAPSAAPAARSPGAGPASAPPGRAAACAARRRWPGRGGRGRGRWARRCTAPASAGSAAGSRSAAARPAAGRNRSAKSRIAWLTTTGSRACGRCPAPSSSSRSPPVSSATRSPRAHGWQRSSLPVDGQHGAADPRRRASVSSRLTDDSGPSSCSSIVSAPISIAQPTQSSRCLVECGSGSSSPKKNSAYPRQSRSQ